MQWVPFYLRHYGTFAEQIHIYDDGSDDGTVELLRAQEFAVRYGAFKATHAISGTVVYLNRRSPQ